MQREICGCLAFYKKKNLHQVHLVRKLLQDKLNLVLNKFAVHFFFQRSIDRSLKSNILKEVGIYFLYIEFNFFVMSRKFKTSKSKHKKYRNYQNQQKQIILTLTSR